MSLRSYQQKRDFTKSEEPEGKTHASEKKFPIFVIQKHAASKLHYDLRLEHKGVLKSWAVPKGPTLNPADKKLAVLVEDHPYDYKDFEGNIPKGNYGAGAVIIWDHGHYLMAGTKLKKTSEKKFTEGFKKGKLSFILSGQKLKGEFTLVRTRYEKNSWLLIKADDEYATKRDLLKQDKSVISQKTIKEIEKKNEKILNNLEKISAAKKRKMPSHFKPMLATLVDKAFDHKDWLFEIKWDGYRSLTRISNKKIELYSRNLKQFNANYPDIVTALKKYQKHELIFDGEIVVVDDKGKPQFEWLQNYVKKMQGNLRYYIFDLLYLDQYDLRNVALCIRKEFLRKLLQDDETLYYCDHILKDGRDFLKVVCKNGLEGIIAKNQASLYQPNVRSMDWLKIKNSYHQEAIISGFTKPRGSRKFFGALILGAYKHNQLTYIGHSGGSFTYEEQKNLYQKLKKIVLKKCPFKTEPETNMPPTWVKPILVCEMKFVGWTNQGVMRAPVYLGLRKDKSAKEVMVEKPKQKEITYSKATKNLTITHPEKIYFPESDYSKKSIIAYYQEIMPYILPHLLGRPQSLHRTPNGIDGEKFYQKDIDFSTPDFVKTVEIYSKSTDKFVRYIICNQAKTLLYMVNLGCIEINPWLSRIENMEYPDFAVVDLDPNDCEFIQVVKTALAVKEILNLLKIPSFCKTSGASGLHIYLPLQGKYTYQVARDFVYLIVNLVHKRIPELTTLQRDPKKRGKTVYLDYLQNRKGQTIAAPYSVRPLPGAPVSTPLLWSEVNDKLNPKAFNLKTIFQRVKRKGDLFANVLKASVNIEKCLKTLERLNL